MRIILFIIFCFSAVCLNAQQIVRNYRTLSYMEEVLNSQPNGKSELSKTEKQARKDAKFVAPSPKTIGVIFHILYATEPERIPSEQIQYQLEALNRDFGLAKIIDNHPNDPKGIFQRRAIDTDIRFCLANPKNPNVNSVNYKLVDVPVWKDLSGIKRPNAGFNAFQTEKYLNIWIAHLPDSISGYAQMPSGPADSDGIVIDYRFFGTGVNQPRFNQGKTLTHLVGNYLGLYPLWGENPCWDDLVEDTPVHNDMNIGCPTTDHISTCDGYPTEMTMNFMDGTDDECMYMFTVGQKQRMHAMLTKTGPRNLLGVEKTECTIGFTESEPLADSRNSESKEKTILKDQLKVFPNPTSNLIYVQFGNTFFGKEVSAEIFSTDGKLILSKTWYIESDEPQVMDLNHQPSGIYLLKVSNKKTEITQKIIVE